MYDLKDIFKTLGLPLALVAVIVALLAWVGLTVEQLAVVAVALVGLQLMQSFVIDVLKWSGLVADDTAGKWSAAFNLLTLVVVGVWMKFFPGVDIYAIDNQLFELAKLLIYVFAYVTQIIGTKNAHVAFNGYGLKQ